MKESITKFDLEYAFKALDEIEVPDVGAVKANKPALTEIFSRKTKFDALMEEYYDISNMAELDDAKDAREAEVAQAKLARIEKIVDLDAESPEDLLPSYVGKFIMQCPQCMTLFYKDPEDIEASEEDPSTVNVNEVCQHCGNESGYTLIGKVGAATQEEMSEYTEEETVDVTSTDEDAESTDELPEETEELSDEDLDLELDALDLDIEDDTDVEKAEESLNSNGGNMILHEGAGADTKHAVTAALGKLVDEDDSAWAKTTADVLDAIPDESIDSIVDEIGKKYRDFKLTAENRAKLKTASNGNLPVTDDTDTIGKLLDMLDSFELAKTSPDLMKTIAVTVIAILGVLEPTPIIEIIALVVAALPADIVANIMAILNPVGLAAAGLNKLYKDKKSKEVSATESLTEEADLDVSADEFEKLINSPEFKKPMSDSDARAMMAELSDDEEETVNESKLTEDHYSDDLLQDKIFDIFNSMKFIHRPAGESRIPKVRRLGNNTYRVAHPLGSAYVTVIFDPNSSIDNVSFTVNGKQHTAKYTKDAQNIIIKELESVYSKQFDIDLGESVTINNETLRFAVINPDGTYAGVPCTSEEEARELAAQKEGRIVVELSPLKEGIFDKLKDKVAGAVEKVTDKLKSREAKADWLLASAMDDYNKARIDASGELVPDKDNKKFGAFVVVGYTDKFSNGKPITVAPDFDNKDLVVGMKKPQVKDKYKNADDIAKGWSMVQGNGPAFIYLAKDEKANDAVFLCQYFKGELRNDQLEKYFGIVKNHLKGVKLMSNGGMDDSDDAEEAQQEEIASDFEKNKAAAKERIDQLANSDEGVATLATVMASLADLQESTLESLVSSSLVEAYGNVAGFRLKECAYTDNKFTIDGTIHFTSGNTRKTTYVFTEALVNNGQVELKGFNEKLGLDKQFAITGRNNNKSFITESFKCFKK